MKVHVVLLFQFNGSSRTKAWEDFTCTHDCTRHIIRMYERLLKNKNPQLDEIEYDIADLYSYVDDVSEILVGCS